MLFDTDVLIWLLRNNERAIRVIDETPDKKISAVTYMEILQGARNKSEIKTIKSLLSDFSFSMLPLTENISHRALIYMEEHCLQTRMCLADALIAATAVENQVVLCTANIRHYRVIKDLGIKSFRP